MTENRKLWHLWDDLAFDALFRSFRLAVGPTKLTIAFLALITICLFGWLMDTCSKSVVVNPKPLPMTGKAFEDYLSFSNATELEVYANNPQITSDFIKLYKGKAPPKGVFSTLWNFGSARFNNATVLLLKLDTSNIFANVINVLKNIWFCVVAIFWALKYHTVYSVIFFSFATIILSLAGGAICRCAALEFAGGEKPGLLESIRFSRRKLKDFLFGPLLPIGLIIICGTAIFLVGLIGNIPWIGEILIGIGLLLTFIFGFFVVLLLLGIAGGTHLMFPTIAYQGSNGADAVSRSFMYVLSEPWWMLFYTFAVTVWGTISYLFVRLFIFLLLIVTHSLLALGIADSPEGSDKLSRIWTRPNFFNLSENGANPANFSESVAAFLVNMSVLLVVGLLVAFVITFYFSASTVIYSLMRKKVDNVPIETVYTQLDQFNHTDQAVSKDKDEYQN